MINCRRNVHASWPRVCEHLLHAHQRRGDVGYQSVEEAGLVTYRDVRRPKAALEYQGVANHAPTISLHEEAARLAWTDAHGEGKHFICS